MLKMAMPKIAMQTVTLPLAGLALVASAALAQQAPEPAGNVDRGKALYAQVGCYACHGLAGQGAQATGPRLSRTQYPFLIFLQTLRHPQKQMPPYEAAVLPDQDAADIYAYVRQMPAPRDPKSIPLLR
jgi:mono/diheme cytochrome c family protein